MNILGNGRVKNTAFIIKTLYAGTVVKPRGEATAPDPEAIEAGTDVNIVAVDKELHTVTVISPLDPDKVLVLAAEAVELYNEGLKIWQGVKAFFKTIGSFFAKIGNFFKPKK
jgi:plastocyanin